jgi:GTPase Era involved in 16S rRNA processing
MVVGNSNTGKSTLQNLLMGQPVFKTNNVIETNAFYFLEYSDEQVIKLRVKMIN